MDSRNGLLPDPRREEQAVPSAVEPGRDGEFTGPECNPCWQSPGAPALNCLAAATSPGSVITRIVSHSNGKPRRLNDLVS